MTILTELKPKAQNLAWPFVLAVLAIAGLFAWSVQLTQGFDVIGTGQEIVWGIYIAAFFLLLGTGCSLVLFVAAGDLGLLSGIQPQRRRLLTFALGMFVAGGIAILMDIGHPARVLNLLFSPQFKSPFIWDFYGLAITFVVTAVYLLTRPKGKVLPLVAGIIAGLVILIEGWILGVLPARPLWHGGFMPALFFLEALVAGSAFVVLTLGDSQPWAKKGLAWLLIILGLVTFVDGVAVVFTGSTAAKASMSLLLQGNLAPAFWGQILLGIVLPVILLLGLPASRGAALTAGVLAISGTLLSKLNLLTAGQALPILGPAESYTPTLVELGGVIGVLALALLLGTLVQRSLPSKA